MARRLAERRTPWSVSSLDCLDCRVGSPAAPGRRRGASPPQVLPPVERGGGGGGVGGVRALGECHN